MNVYVQTNEPQENRVLAFRRGDDGAVSRYAIGSDGSLRLEDAAAGIAVEGATGLRDEDLTGDGRFLYAIDADAQRIFGWSVGADGALEPVGSWEGIPATVAGLAAS